MSRALLLLLLWPTAGCQCGHPSPLADAAKTPDSGIADAVIVDLLSQEISTADAARDDTIFPRDDATVSDLLASSADTPTWPAASTPILHRQGSHTHRCSVEHPAAELADTQWGHMSAVHNGVGYYVARQRGLELLLSAIEEDGTLGETHVVATLSEGSRGVTLAYHNSLFYLIAQTIQGQQQSFGLWTINALGETISTLPHLGTISAVKVSSPKIIGRGQEFHLLWRQTHSHDENSIRFARFSNAGALLAEPTVVLETGRCGQFYHVNAEQDDYAVIGNSCYPQSPGQYLIRLDSLGAKTLERKLPVAQSASEITSIKTDSGWLLAWQERPEFASRVMLGRVSEQGDILGRQHPLSPTTEHNEDFYPVLSSHNGLVGLFWQHGKNYSDEGGRGNHLGMRFVLLDPNALTAVSATARFGSSILRFQPVQTECCYLALYQHAYHLYTIPSTAFLRCSAL